MDWETFMAGLSTRDQAIIQFMIEGKTGSALARKLKVCDSTISNSKRNLAVKILEFMGCEILVDIQRSPRWKQDLQATRERMACREERKH
jgi:FixJ family two-component response regulator